MRPELKRLSRRCGAAAAIVVALATALAASGGTAVAGGPASCPSSTEDAYAMSLLALTGPAGADLTITVTAKEGCGPVESIKKVQMKTFGSDGALVQTRNVKDVAAPGGVANLDLGNVPRDRRVEADVLIQTGAPPRTYVLREAATTLLRPDLVVESVTPQQTLAGVPVVVSAVIAERNGDIGATGAVSMSAIPGSFEPVTVPPGGKATVTFAAATFTDPIPIELTVAVGNAAPRETDATNNSRATTLEVTEHQIPTPRTVLFPSLLGYGAQFNGHLYAPVTPWPANLGYGNAEEKVKMLEPQLVRIFYNDNWDGNANGQFTATWQKNYASFVKVTQLAQESGATIEISFQSVANAKSSPGPAMAKFAAVLEDLVKAHGLTNVTWAEVGNEPNSGSVTLDEIKALYQALHDELVARGLHDQVRLMAPGLIELASNADRNHYDWTSWIAANMAGLVDGYAEHVYWVYNDTGRLEYRLRDTAHLLSQLPAEQQKPMYMMEFGIRGLAKCGTKPTFADLYYAADPDCSEIWRTNIAGFQQLWFTIDSAQLGVAGASKWDAFWGRYDNSSATNQLYWMVGPPTEGSPLTPTYWAMSLAFHTTEPGWQIIQVEPWNDSDWSVKTYGVEGHSSNDQPEKELVAYAGSTGELTVLGLDTHGKALNTVSPDASPAYSIGGLPPGTTFNLALWNATGDGTNSLAGTVTTNAAGVARSRCLSRPVSRSRRFPSPEGCIRRDSWRSPGGASPPAPVPRATLGAWRHGQGAGQPEPVRSRLQPGIEHDRPLLSQRPSRGCHQAERRMARPRRGALHRPRLPLRASSRPQRPVPAPVRDRAS